MGQLKTTLNLENERTAARVALDVMTGEGASRIPRFEFHLVKTIQHANLERKMLLSSLYPTLTSLIFKAQDDGLHVLREVIDGDNRDK